MTYDFKSEWVLNGDTVLYASFDTINDTLDYYIRTGFILIGFLASCFLEKRTSYEAVIYIFIKKMPL